MTHKKQTVTAMKRRRIIVSSDEEDEPQPLNRRRLKRPPLQEGSDEGSDDEAQHEEAQARSVLAEEEEEGSDDEAQAQVPRSPVAREEEGSVHEVQAQAPMRSPNLEARVTKYSLEEEEEEPSEPSGEELSEKEWSDDDDGQWSDDEEQSNDEAECGKTGRLPSHPGYAIRLQRQSKTFNALGRACRFSDHTAEATAECGILSSVNMYYHHTHGRFVCRDHGHLIPLSELLQHLHHHVRDQSEHKTLWRKSILPLFHHILTGHGLDEHAEDVPVPTDIDSPIPGLKPPKRRQRCPFCDSSLVVQKKNMDVHLKTHHAELSATVDISAIPVLWAQEVSAKAGRKPVVAFLPEGWTPSLEALATDINEDKAPQLASSATDANRQPSVFFVEPQFLDDIGWNEYLASLGKSCSLKRLRGLVALPSESMAKRFKGKRRSLEQGLLAIHKFNREYLKQASAFVKGRHQHFADALTAQ
jgi:hypothetical protein